MTDVYINISLIHIHAVILSSKEFFNVGIGGYSMLKDWL